jgi:hypothetical protein
MRREYEGELREFREDEQLRERLRVFFSSLLKHEIDDAELDGLLASVEENPDRPLLH